MSQSCGPSPIFEKTAPILFLDFDGVLHPENCPATALFSRVSLLWKILRACPDLRVVFSTSWRKTSSFNDLLARVTDNGGEDLAARFVGVTPVINLAAGEGDYRWRESECLRWREEAGHAGPWLALDDVHYWFGFDSPNAYLTNYQTGLTANDVDRVVERLNQLCR